MRTTRRLNSKTLVPAWYVRPVDLNRRGKTLHWTAFARLIDLPVLASYRNELLSIAPEEFTKNFRLEEKPVKTESIISARLEATDLQPDGDISGQTTEEQEEQTLEDLPIEKEESSATGQRQAGDMAAATGSVHCIVRKPTICHYLVRRRRKQPSIRASRLSRGISYAEAVVTFEEVVRRFGNSTTPAVYVQVARALLNKGVALGGLNQLDSELAAYEEVVHRFSGSSEPTLLYMAATATARKVFVLGKLERFEEGSLRL